jgi:hypothetical protein
MLAAAPELVRDGLAYRAALRRAGVPILHRHAVIRAEGKGAVERAVIARIDRDGRPVPGSEKAYEVDAVCTGFGFLPSNEIARALGCRHNFDARRGQLIAERDHNGRSSVAHVWIAGDSAGLGGARLAEADGFIAAADIVKDLGRKPLAEAKLDAARRAAERARRFQAALWRLFAAPRMLDQLARPDTVICRCEDITLGAVREAIAGEMASAGAIKRLTRAGMGRCQGRYCGPLIVELAAKARGAPVEELSFFAPRMPFKPVPIGILSSAE